MRIEAFVDHRLDTAVFAHLDDVDALRVGACKHPVLFLKLCDHAFDAALCSERLAAPDAVEGIFFLQHARRRIPRMVRVVASSYPAIDERLSVPASWSVRMEPIREPNEHDWAVAG